MYGDSDVGDLTLATIFGMSPTSVTNIDVTLMYLELD